MSEEKNEFIIKNQDDMLEALERIDDIDFLHHTIFKLDPEEPLKIRIRFEGSEFDRSVTTSIMRGILKIQDAIYDLYRIEQNEGYRLTAEDKQKLELKIEVDRGSSIVDILLQNSEAIVNKMSGPEILIGLGIGSIAILGFATINKIAEHKKEALKNKRDEIMESGRQEAEKDLARIADKALSVLETVSGDMRSAYRNMAVSEADNISIQEDTYTPEELKDLTKAKRVRKEKVVSTLESSFIVRNIDLNREEETYIDIEDTQSGKYIKHVSIQKSQISEGDYTIIKEAVNRDPISFRVITEEKGEKIVSAYVDTSSIKGSS